MNKKQLDWPPSKNKLKYFYQEKLMTLSEISDIYNKSTATIWSYVDNYNIKTRNQGTVKKTHEKFKKEFKELVGDKYLLLSKYKTAHNKIDVLHKKCNYKYSVTPNHFLNGKRCPKCAGRLPITNKQFKQKVEKEVGKEYSVLGEYKKAKIKIKMKHNKCGYEYKVTPSHFMEGKRCPKCAHRGISSGEKLIEIFLKNNKINYDWQFTFNDCKNIQVLPFDFKIKDKPIVIEYNGVQHYEPVEYFGGKEQFEYQQKNDKIKKEYCKENGIKLITIPYFEKENIKEILEKEL